MKPILLLFLILNLLHHCISNLEVCEPFPIHHNFYNCYENGGLRRAVNQVVCPNQGTWTCSNFNCFYDDRYDGACINGYLNQSNCCTHKDIHYVDMWVNINNASVELRRKIENGWGFKIDIYNIEILIANNNIEVNGTLWVDVIPNLENKETFINIILRYEEDCALDIEIYINATLVVNMTYEYGFIIWTSDEYPTGPMIKLIYEDVNVDDLVFFTSAHTLIPTLEEIQYLYGLGKNRSTGVELCYNTTCPECEECEECNITNICEYSCNITECEECEESEECTECSTTCLEGGVPTIYRTLTIIFSVIMGILLFVIFLIFAWLFVRGMSNPSSLMGGLPTSNSIKKMNEGTFVELKEDEDSFNIQRRGNMFKTL